LYVKGGESELGFQACFLKITRKFLVETIKIQFMDLMAGCELKLSVVFIGKYNQATNRNSLFKKNAPFLEMNPFQDCGVANCLSASHRALQRSCQGPVGSQLNLVFEKISPSGPRL